MTASSQGSSPSLADRISVWCQRSCPLLFHLTVLYVCGRSLRCFLRIFLGVHRFERVHKITEFHLFDRLIGAFRVTYAHEVEELSNSLPLWLFLHVTSPADHRCCTVRG